MNMSKAQVGAKKVTKIIRKEILGELVPFLTVAMGTSHKPGCSERALHSLATEMGSVMSKRPNQMQ